MNEERWPTGLTGRAPARRPGGVRTRAPAHPSRSGRGPTPTVTTVPDTLLTTDGVDLLVYSDLDADGLADRVLRIDGGGSVHPDPHPDVGLGGPVTGSARAGWSGLLGVLFGPDP